jgi:acetoin utilization deacetylase AcuC-like enzyme
MEEAAPLFRLHITCHSEIQIGDHVFPTQKYRLIKESLLALGLARHAQFVEAPSITPDWLRRVHSREYLEDFLNCRNSWRTNRSELPLRPDILGAYLHGAMATVCATEDAVHNRRGGLNIGGGFHHAFADHAEGFCYLHDVAVAIRHGQFCGWFERVLVVDLDVHQGNGTAHIFQDDPQVFTFSMHQEDNYPPKQKSDLDLGLRDGIDDREYLSLLTEHLPKLLDDHDPQLVHYLAGADPYFDDKLGGLNLTIPGLLERDRIVLHACRDRQIPVVITLAGGYARDTQDTVTIHRNTLVEAMQFWS